MCSLELDNLNCGKTILLELCACIWPLSRDKASYSYRDDFIFIQTLLLFVCIPCCFYASKFLVTIPYKIMRSKNVTKQSQLQPCIHSKTKGAEHTTVKWAIMLRYSSYQKVKLKDGIKISAGRLY